MAEKRRREDEPDETNSDANKVMILEAKNKGLATNLYSYKRHIQRLENQVSRLGKNNTEMYTLLNTLQANLLQMESDLRDCLSFVPSSALDTSIRAPLEAVSRSLDSTKEDTETASSSSSPSHHPLYESIADPNFLKFLLSSTPSSEEVSTLYTTVTTTLDSSSSSSSTPSTVDYTDTPPVTIYTPPELFLHHIQFLQKASRSIIQTVMHKATSSSSSSSSSAPTITKEHIEDIQARHRAAINHVTALQAEIRQRDTNLHQYLQRIKALEEEARTTVRTLERLRYDHPELEEKIRNTLATSQFTSPLPPTTITDASSSTASSSHNTLFLSSTTTTTDQMMDTTDSTKSLTVQYPDTPQSMLTDSVASTPLHGMTTTTTTTYLSSASSSTASQPSLPVPSHSFLDNPLSTPSTPSHLQLSRSNSLQGGITDATPSIHDIDTLRTERDTLRTCIDDLQTKYDLQYQRLLSLEESLKQENLSLTALQKRYQGNLISDKDVQSHSLYIDLFQVHATLNDTVHQLETKLAESDSKLFAIQDELSLERSRYNELLQVTGLNDQHTRKAYDEQIDKLYQNIHTVTKERDQSFDNLAEYATRNQMYEQLEKTFKEQTNALESWKQQYNTIHTTLSQRVNTLLSSSSSSSSSSTDLSQLQTEIIDLRNERDGLIASLENVSSAFESAGSERDKILALLTEKDNEMHRSLLTAQQFQGERMVLLSEMATKDNVIQELKMVQETATAALATKDTLVNEYRQRVSSTEEKLTELEKQLQYYRDRRSTDQRYNVDYQKQIQSMKEKLDNVYQDINEYIDKDKVHRQTIQDLQTKYDELMKKYGKLEEKYTKVKEKEKETSRLLTASASKAEGEGTVFTPGLGRSISTVSLSSTGDTASSMVSPLDMAELNILRSLVNCTVCKVRRRNCTLNRCHHTFCRNCIDDRVKLRQRKCPSCNTVFAENDIQTIYLA